MTEKEFRRLFKLIDAAKWALFNQRIAFDWHIRFKDGECWHCGIGTGEQMTEFNLRSLYDLYRTGKKDGVTPEDFAESVKDAFIKYADRHEEGSE